jgi:hypothetical protein
VGSVEVHGGEPEFLAVEVREAIDNLLAVWGEGGSTCRAADPVDVRELLLA